MKKENPSRVAPRLASSILWNIGGAIVARGSTLLGAFLLARLVGKEAFGQFGMVQGTIFMVGPLAGTGLGQMATKYVAQFRSTEPIRATRIVKLSSTVGWLASLIVGVFLFISAGWVARSSLDSPDLATTLRFAVPLLIFSVLCGVQTGSLAGFEAFTKIARLNVYNGLATIPCMLIGLYQAGINGAILGLGIAGAVQWFFGEYALRAAMRESNIPLTADEPFKEWPALIKFILPSLISSLLIAPVAWAGNTMLVKISGGYSEMGIVNAAMQWRNVMLFLPMTLGGVYLPLLSNLHAKNDVVAYKKLLRTSLLLTTSIAAVQSIVVILFGNLILAGFGKNFLNGYYSFSIFILSAAIIAINNTLSRAVASQGKMWIDLLMNSVWATTFVALCILLIPQYLSLGLAYATLGAAILQGLFQFIFIFRKFPSASPKTSSALQESPELL